MKKYIYENKNVFYSHTVDQIAFIIDEETQEMFSLDITTFMQNAKEIEEKKTKIKQPPRKKIMEIEEIKKIKVKVPKKEEIKKMELIKEETPIIIEKKQESKDNIGDFDNYE